MLHLVWMTPSNFRLLPNDFDYASHRFDPRGILVGLYDNHVCYGVIAYLLYPKYFFLSRIHIFEEYRLKGYGKRAIQLFIEKMSNSRDSILCEVPEHDISSQLFLKSCGFFGWPSGKNIEFRLTLKESEL